MIEKTNLNNKIITDLLRNNYNLEVKKIEKIKRGSANLFKISTKDKIYVLKEFQTNYDNEDIKKEIDIINHLSKDGIKVPVYIETKEKEYSIKYNNRTIIVQEFIEGETLKTNTGNYEQVIESAKTLGLIVKSLETFPYQLPTTNVSNWYSLDKFNDSIKKHEDLVLNTKNKQIKELLLEKVVMINNIKNQVQLEDINKITYKNTHGDYSVMQFIYKNGQINAVIDFVAASYLPIIWEIARSYSYIDKDCRNGKFNINHFVDYVKEFNKYVKLNEYDLKYMPYIYLFQLLNSTYGFKQYINDNTKKDLLNFGILRFNICKYLYKNAEFISNKLQESIK